MRKCLIVCLLMMGFVANAQSPKREFRAAWIATVANIDWPSKQGLPAEQQKAEFIHRLNQLQDIGCNAVIVQVRPASDAFYDSKIEPWSHYLTGRQGEAPSPYYDPLTFMVEEAHKRNMEFHAWFNPYRGLVDSKKNPNPPDHITRRHPEWMVSYGGKTYLNPGEPKVREYVTKIICDVVKRYDIDAVHIDDYFYPYRIAGQEFGDGRCYASYGKGMNKEDWRRDNVNTFIENLNSEIKDIKPYMKLGISPFGVWRNASKDPEGSATHGGQTCYDDLYADVLLWMRKGWIDYLLPQLYWEHGHRAAPFDVLLPWWQEHSYGRHVYDGLGVYRMQGGRGIWASAHEILWQIRDIRADKGQGYVFYSASSFDKIGGALKDSLTERTNRYPALPPTMPWLDKEAPAAPVVTLRSGGRGSKLEWTNNSNEKLRYVVYRFSSSEDVNINRSDRIMSIQQKTEYTDTESNGKTYTYVVTALDRLWNESKPSNKVGGGQQ